jgi:hypothetical protein
MEEFEVSEASKKTKTIYISTIFSIALVLLMLGMLGLILVHAKNLSDYVKENIVLNIIVDEGAKETDILAFEKELKSDVAIKTTQYINKEVAQHNLTKDLGEDFVNFLGYNPLLSTIDVYLKADYANNKNIDALRNCHCADQQHHPPCYFLPTFFNKKHAIGWCHEEFHQKTIYLNGCAPWCYRIIYCHYHPVGLTNLCTKGIGRYQNSGRLYRIWLRFYCFGSNWNFYHCN